MTFELLEEEAAQCDCISKANLDTTSTFICSVGSNNPKVRDFLSKWERYKTSGKDLPFKDCIEMCALKGVSMNKLDGYDESEIIEAYKQRLIFSQKSKTFIFKFNLSVDVGVVEHTPNHDHHSHHDLFKCDGFNVDGFKNPSVSKLELEDDAT
jgi:hypothetical protein